jgi:uncharacterized protein DUF4160
VTRIRRGGYIFVTWIGDHAPLHVHVFRDGRLILKWNLEKDLLMEGKASPRVLELIHELRRDGLL